jgi:hypothetical protein
MPVDSPELRFRGFYRWNLEGGAKPFRIERVDRRAMRRSRNL